MEKEFYSVKEVAHIFEVSEDRVRSWLKNGWMKGERASPTSAWLIPMGEIARIREESRDITADGKADRVSAHDPTSVTALRVHKNELLKKANEILSEAQEAILDAGKMAVWPDTFRAIFHNPFDLDIGQLKIDVHSSARHLFVTEHDMMYELVWEHLSGQQIAEDYKECLKKIDLIEDLCLELAVDICRSVKNECRAVFDNLDVHYRRIPKPVVVKIQSQWDEFTDSLKDSDPEDNLVTLLKESCRILSVKDSTLVLGFHQYSQRQIVEEPSNRRLLEQKMADFFGSPNKVLCKLLRVERHPLSNPDNWPQYITPEFAETIYNRATLRSGIRKQTGTYKLPYRIDKHRDLYTSTLFLGNVELIRLPSQVLKQIKIVHQSLIQRYASSELAKRIIDESKALENIAQRMENEFEIMLAKRIMPGKCRACP